jgi:hypothetical protein
MEKRSFNAVIKRHDHGWHIIEVPFKTKEAYGMESRIPVNATVDGLAFRTSLIPGDEGHYIVINEVMREATGKDLGDTISIELDVDDRPRELTVPVDIQQALHKDKNARERYTALSYSSRKRYIEWVAGAKKPETRARRVARLIDELKAPDKTVKKS